MHRSSFSSGKLHLDFRGLSQVAPWPRIQRWIALGLGIGALACSGDASATELTEASPTNVADERVGQVQSAIIGGSVDRGASDAVVQMRIGTSSYCSGTLIAPNLVLTARHCVSKTQGPSITCTSKGESVGGPQVASDVDPGTIAIYLGVFTSSLEDLPVARGTYVVHEDSNVLCNKDMAIVVLNRSVPNVTPLPVRVSAALTPGEQVRAIGYGLNDVGLPTGTRLRRENVPVLAMGPGISASRTSLGNREFEAGTSFCQGDSGGPAISEVTGAVVGVVSRGRADCNTENGNVYTSTAGFTTLFQKAEELSGSVVTHEQGAATGDQAVASDTTAMTGTLPLVTSNLQSDGNSHEGCSISPSQPIRSAGPLAGWTMLAGVALLLRRRQRRSTP